MLVEHRADLKYKYWNSQSAVIMTDAKGSNHILEYLVEQDVDINYQNAQGETALMNAIRSGNKTNVELLLQFGADISLKNSDGRTALDIVKSEGLSEIAKFIETFQK